MKLRTLLFSTLLVLTAAKVQAQVGLYANLSAQHVGAANGQTFGGTGNSSNGMFLYGPTFGLYNDFLHAGPLHVGADMHGSILSNGDAKLNNFLLGFRAAVKPPVLPIKPYIQASAGVAGFNYGRRVALTNSFEYEIDGGVDLTFLPRLDWRIIEVGAGALTHNGPGANAGNGLFHISTGLVFRLPF